jgi:hypothetical protein
MPEYATFQGPAGSVLLEIAEGDGEGGGSADLRDVTRVIQDVAIAASAEIERLAKDKRPTEFELAFAVRGLPGGQGALVLDPGLAHFRVSMRWNSLVPQVPSPDGPPPRAP